jgi:hypothetical protein
LFVLVKFKPPSKGRPFYNELAIALQGVLKAKQNRLKWFVLGAGFSKRPAHALAPFAAGELKRWALL